MSKYPAQPKKLENFTQSGEDQVFVGKRNVTDFLPSILQTDTNKRFLSSTLDQLLSSGSTETLDTYWGRIKGKDFRPGRDLFVPETNAQRINNQLAPGISLKDGDSTQEAVTYNSVFNMLKKVGSDIDNIDKLTREPGYTLDLPLNSDMFINFINYYWLADDIPPCVIEPTSNDPIDIDNICRLSHYTTPTLANGKTLEFLNGMRVIFTGSNVTSASGNYRIGVTYWVEGVGTKNIKFVEHIDEFNNIKFYHVQPYTLRLPSDWDGDSWDSYEWDYSSYKAPLKEYVVADRSSVDKNAWARANQWYSIYALRNTCTYNEIDITEYSTTENRGQRPIICWEQNLELFDAGQNFIENIDHVITGIDVNTTILGQATYTNAEVSLDTDDIILFIDCGVYSSGIYRVQGVGTAMTLFQLHAPNSYNTLDKVLVLHGPDLPGVSTGYPGLELYWNGAEWVQGQQKQHRGDSPLFQLYSDIGVKLDEYQEPDFEGNTIFRYAPNSAGVFDPELGFAPSYNDANIGNDINFELTLNTVKYSTDLATPAARFINGYYYAKDIVNSKLINGWSKIRGDQRTLAIKTHIATQDETVVFKNVITDNSNHDTTYLIEYTGAGFVFSENSNSDLTAFGEHNPTLCWNTDKTYHITDIIPNSVKRPVFTDPYGNTDPNIIITPMGQNEYELKVLSTYPYSTVYYMESDVHATYNNVGYYNSGNAINTPEFAGRIYLTNDNQNRIKVYKNNELLTESIDYTLNASDVTINTPANENEIFEISYIQNVVDKENLPQTRDVAFDASPIFKYNPLNESLSVASFSSLLTHFRDQFESVVGFDGASFGENNLHKTFNEMHYGGTIREQVFTPVKLGYLMSNPQTNPFNALRKLSNDYQNFVTYFKTKVKQLWKTSSSDLTVREIVNAALSEINIGKNNTFNYGKSDMIYYNAFEVSRYSVTDTTVDFQSPYPINRFMDTENHVYVYLKEFNGNSYVWRLLVKDLDYTIDVDIVTLTQPATLNTAGDPATVEIYWKDFNSYSYVPPSTVKLGFFKPTQVEVIDGVLHGHDGSTHVCENTEFYDTTSSSFDIVTACLIEFENRVLAGLLDLHDRTTEVTRVLPNANYSTSNTWNDMKFILDDWYNVYATQNNIVGFSDAGYYNPADEFTWNYSSVTPTVAPGVTASTNLGSWKALYTYYFGTYRPHTHPWEMLGHRVKPLWWDTYYSWTDPVKRTSLINSLLTGEVNEPNATIRVTDSRYAKTAYDWTNNTLVTTSGVLNGPVTAGVVSAPNSIEASKLFDFNDWGPYEDGWRQTSAYKFALVECAMIFKPFRVFEQFFNLTNIATVNTPNTKHRQFLNLQNRVRANLDNIALHQESTDTKTLVSAEVIAGGQGYNNSTSMSVNSVIGSVDFRTRVSGGQLKAISVVKTVAGFDDNVSLSVIGVQGSSGAEAKGYTDLLLPVYMGFNNVVYEWSKIYNVTPDNIKEDFRDLEVELMLHVGGYTDKNIINVRLDSSYQKGPVEIPKQDFSIILNKSAPVKSVFYSGLKITKSSLGYTVSGFNSQDRTFTIIPVSEGGTVYKDTIGNLDIKRYANFKNIPEKYSYGYTMLKRQELYNFILGLAEYYERNGFHVRERWLQDARSAMEWSLSDSPDPLYINGILTTLEFEQGPIGYVDYVGYNYDGTANIINKNNKQIKPNQLLVLRNDTTTEFSLKDVSVEIFGLSVNVVEYEHVITLNNVSQFNDQIFDPVLGTMHTRVKLEGERTRNWNGRIEAPGYLVKSDGLLSNLESSVREVERDNVNSDSKTLNLATRETSRFNVGFLEGSYLSNTFIEDNAAYNFGKGQRKMKGTHTAIDAFMRNRNLFGTNPEHDVFEEWMIRLGDYGDKTKRNPIEVQLDSNLIKTNPQAIRFNNTYVSDDSSDLIIDYHSGSTSVITGDLERSFEVLPEFRVDTTIADAKRFENFLPNAGLPLSREAEYKIANIDDIGTVYSILEEYANISNWSSSVAYKQGDKVRKDGKVYQLAITTTGLTTITDPITVRGTQIYPSVPSGDTVIIDGTTVTLSKTSTVTTYNPINIDGTVVTPSVPNNSTLIIDGTTVTLNKTTTTTTYDPIVVTGTVGNPVVTGNPGEGLLIDGIFVDLVQNATTTTNISALSALVQAFSPAFVTLADENTLAVARINAIEDLRVAYTALNGTSAWISWIGNYYTGGNSISGLNIAYLNSELASANPGYATELTALLQNDIDIVNQCTNQSYSIGNQPITADINTSIAALDTGAYMPAFSTYVKTGASVLTGSTVDTVASTTPRLWDIDDIVQVINSVLTSNNNTTIVATKNASSQLVITKTASAGDSSLIIGAAGSNAEVGFLLNSTAYNSTTNTVVAGANLSLVDVINEINNASITGVSATYNNDTLRITSINQTIVIGSGTANAFLGISLGTTNATTTVSTAPSDLQIFDLVDQINNASISGVTAGNVNNNLIISSSNTTLTIGNGTANDDIGLSVGTFSSEESVENTFNLSDWNQIEDPANFRIWVLNNIGQTTLNENRASGYNMFQVFDFNIEIEEICAGNRIGDDALVKTMGMGGSRVSTGDFIVIINSGCTPSVDGIHQVVGVEDDMHFYIDKYIESLGVGGKMLLLRPTKFNDTVEMQNTLTNTKYYDNGLGWRPGMLAYVDNVIVNGVGTKRGAVYKATQTDSGIEFVKLRDQAQRADNTKIKNAVLYNSKTQTLMETFEVFHPLAGIIPGAVDKELSFKSESDLAIYTNTTDEFYTTNEENYWDEQYIGDTWWDLSNAIYYDYEQGDLVYKQGWWATLFPTGSIDIYEWTKSTVTPDQYEDAVTARTIVDGVQLTGVPYTRNGPFGETLYYWTEITEYNNDTEKEETFYYFWVKDKTTKIGEDRSFTTTQLTNILLNPGSFGYNWVAATGSSTNNNQQNSILVSNLEQFINNGESVLQLNFTDIDVDLHREYLLLAQDDPSTVIPQWLHMGLRDSIASFDKHTITESFVVWNNLQTYTQGTMVQSPLGDFYRANTNNQNNNPDINVGAVWSKIYDGQVLPDGTFVDINALTVEYSAPNPVPDTNLHPLARYGNLIRPRQSWIKNLQESRRVLVDKLNRQIVNINLVDTIPNWDRVLSSKIVSGQNTYDFTTYWEFIDWKTDKFISGMLTDRTVTSKLELGLVPGTEGETALVLTSNDSDGVNRQQIYQYINGVWEIQYKEKATIRFKDLLWDYATLGYGWDNGNWDFYSWDNDPGAVLGEILDTIRFDVYVGQFQPLYADMWFTMLNYINSEQNNLDWAFKTTYIKTVIKHPLFKETKLFELDRIDDVIDYINEVKPFHTKLRNLYTQRDYTEGFTISAQEYDNRMVITERLNQFTNTGFSELTLLGGNNWEESTHTDISSFTTYSGASGADVSNTVINTSSTSHTIDGSNSDFTHIYVGDGFLQPQYAGHADEVYPAFFDEAIELRVTTNTNGSTEDADTRRFRLFTNSNRETEAAVINISTSVSANVGVTDDQIAVTDATVLYQSAPANGVGDVRGVVWINNERITYTHVHDGKLMNCVRGTGGTSVSEHTIGDTVYDGGPGVQIPMLTYIQQYGQSLRPAFNDFGKSLTNATSTSDDAVFVYRNG